MQNYIIYRSYGNSHYLQECRYSLLKYLSVYNLKPPVNTTLVVYTDQPHLFEAFIPFFRDFRLQEVLTSTQPKADFISHLSQTYQGNILYCDSDTYILSPIDPVFEKIKNKQVCLHREEDLESKPPAFQQKLKDALSVWPVVNGAKVTSPGKLPLYSADTIGFRHQDGQLLKQASNFQELLTGELPESLAWQLAFSFSLQSRNVHLLHDQIASYRNLPEFKELLHTFFIKNEEESIPNLVKSIQHLDARTIKEEKDRYNQLPFLKKLLNKFTGKGWSIRQYQNKI